MTKYQEKLLKGETPDSSEWTDYLKASHRAAPSMTPRAFDSPRNCAGLNSYQILANASQLVPHPNRLLDLACGDGHLIPYVRRLQGSNLSIVGVDMSEAELAIAKEKYADRQTSFRCETGDAIHEPDSSFDVVLCHMALMLMSPIDLVVKEIARLLKSGGIFAGVVGASSAPGFYSTYLEEFGKFMKSKYPAYKPHSGGDPRTRTAEGLKELLSAPLFMGVLVEDFSVSVKGSPKAIGSFFEDMYNVSLLPQAEREEFKQRIISCAETVCHGQSELSFDFPMRLFKAFKS